MRNWKKQIGTRFRVYSEIIQSFLFPLSWPWPQAQQYSSHSLLAIEQLKVVVTDLPDMPFGVQPLAARFIPRFWTR
ncbi:MAG: hypothetical protein M3Q32_05980 [Pseudomonadota bacterium]|nr:hypothetical protein [Pseudomonadota bacterium]